MPNQFDETVTLMADRDRAAEDALNKQVAQGQLSYINSGANDVIAGPGPTTLADFVITVTVPENRLLRVSAKSQVQVSADSNWYIDLLEDAVATQRVFEADFNGVGNRRAMWDGFALVTPAAGTHTYSFTAVRFGGAGSLTIEGSADFKQMLVEDIGPANRG